MTFMYSLSRHIEFLNTFIADLFKNKFKICIHEERKKRKFTTFFM